MSKFKPSLRAKQEVARITVQPLPEPKPITIQEPHPFFGPMVILTVLVLSGVTATIAPHTRESATSPADLSGVGVTYKQQPLCAFGRPQKDWSDLTGALTVTTCGDIAISYSEGLGDLHVLVDDKGKANGKMFVWRYSDKGRAVEGELARMKSQYGNNARSSP